MACGHACHHEYRPLLLDDHQDVDKGKTAHCLVCHKPDASGDPSPDVFSALIHRSHAGAAKCMDCHPWKEGGTFDLPHPGGCTWKTFNRRYGVDQRVVFDLG